MNSKIIIITLNYNQNNYTIKCIDSLLSSEYSNFKILLIDNGSTKENYTFLRSNLPRDNRLELIRIEENRGYVGGVNYGLETGAKLNPDYFLVMNNDTIIDKYAIKELVKTCKDYNNKAIITGKVYHYDNPNKLQDIGYAYNNEKRLQFNRVGFNEIDKGQYNKIAERDMLDDVFWLLPKRLFEKIGGYSPYFWFNAEQADFALKAKKAGYKLIFTPKAKLWHKGSVSIGGREKNPKLAYWHIQSTLILRYRHLSKNQFIIHYFEVLKGIFATYLKMSLKYLQGKEHSFMYAKAKLMGLMYFNKWLFIRNENTGYIPFH